jgi:hypothetical protein
MNREAIYSALFAKLKTIDGFVTCSRKLKHWADVDSINQPALFQAQIGEVAQRLTNQPTRWTLNVHLYLYANTADLDLSPSQVLNPLIDDIITALEPPVGEVQTLGGLVQYCRVSGEIVEDEGVLGVQAVVRIPIEILTT